MKDTILQKSANNVQHITADGHKNIIFDTFCEYSKSHQNISVFACWMEEFWLCEIIFVIPRTVLV